MIHPTKSNIKEMTFLRIHSKTQIIELFFAPPPNHQPISINQAAWLGLAQLSPEPERNSCDRRAVRVAQTNSSTVRE